MTNPKRTLISNQFYTNGLLYTFLLLSVTSCSDMLKGDSSTKAIVTNDKKLAEVSLVRIYEKGIPAPIFESNQASQVSLDEDKDYQIEVSVKGAEIGAAFTVTILKDIGGSFQFQTFNAALTDIPKLLNGEGAYTFQVTSADNVKIGSIDASIDCKVLEPLKASDLNAAGIVVTPNGANNVFRYSASAVVRNPEAHDCAWDATGMNIVSSAFMPCNVIPSFYTNYVGDRNVGVLVRDKCLNVQRVNAPRNLAYTVPAEDETFIFGKTSAHPNVRLGNVNYLATNPQGYSRVYATYQQQVTEGISIKSFRVVATNTFNTKSSVAHGMTIELQGFKDTFDLKAGTGNVDVSNVKMTYIGYSTDGAGDTLTPLFLQGNRENCTLKSITATPKKAVVPCFSAPTGSLNMFTVVVWGEYVCTGVTDGVNSINITGSFGGNYNIADSCNGGGGGAPGGVPNVEL